MSQPMYNLEDITTHYLEFIHKTDCPKIENLTNWGCQRYFFAQYFVIKDCCCMPERILIEFNARTYQLDTTKAPNFLDQQQYIGWLQQQFLS